MSDDLTLAIKLAMDNSSFQQGIQNLKREMEVVQSQFRESTAGMKDWGKNLDSLKGYADALTQKIDIQKKVVQAYQEQLNKSKTSLEDNAKKMLELKDKVGQAEQTWKNAEKTLGKNAEETQKLKSEYEKLKKEYDQQEQKVRNNQKAVEGYTIQLNNAKAKLNEMESELKQSTSEIDRQSNSWLKLSEKAKEVGDKLKNVGDKMSSVGSKLSTVVTLPLLGVGTAATKMAMDAVESENLFEVAMGAMANDARKWSEETSKALGLNAYNVRKNVATYNSMLTSMGLTTQESLKMSEGLTQLSYDMASFYNLKPEEAFEKLKSGISGEAEPLKALGILVNDNTIKTYAYSHGIAKQGEALTEQQKVMARYGVIMESTKNAQGDLARTMDSPTNKLRVMKEQAEQLGIQFGQSLIPILENLIGVIKPLMDKFQGLSKEQQESIVKIGLIVAAVGPVIMIIGKVISIAGTLFTVIGTVSGAMATAGAGAGATGGMLAALTGPIGIAVAAITGLIAIFVALYKNNEDFRNSCNEAWQQIKQTITSITEQIKTIIQGFIQLVSAIWNAWGKDIMNIVSTVFTAIVNIINPLLNTIAGVIKTITTLIKGDWQGVWEGIKQITKGVWDFIKATIEGTLNIIKSIISAVWNAIKGIIEGILNGIKAIITTIWNSIKSTIESVVNGVKSVVTSVWNSIKSTTESVFNGIKSTATSVWNGIKSAIETPINAAKDTVKSAIDSIYNFFANLHLPEIQIPHIKIPHFSLQGKFSLEPPSVPSFGIDWYANGGILTKPTAFGFNGNKLMVGGEAGAEGIIPLKQLWSELDKNFNKLEQRLKGNNGITQNVVINSPTSLSPSEIARQNKRALQELALQL